MDATDQQIVLELQRDARQPVRDVASAVGVAVSTAFQRIRRLHEAGVIVGYHAEVDMHSVGRAVQALVFAQVRPMHRELIDAFQHDASDMPEVLAVFVLAGGDDFLLHVGVPTVESLHTFLVDTLSRRREVVSFRTSIVFRHSRNPAVKPLLQ